MLLSCGGADTPTKVPDPVKPDPVVPVPSVAAVTVTGPAMLVVGREDTVKASPVTAAGAAIPGKSVAWASSNTALVTVSGAGVVRAVAPGTATISATVDGVIGTVAITATDPSLASLSVSAPPALFYVGQTAQLTASGRDSVNAPLALRSVEWATSNAAVATVSSTGLVRGVTAGTATITATGTTIFSKTATATVTVQLVPVAKVVFNPPPDTLLHLRQPMQLSATAYDSADNVLARPITYTSSNVNVALITVDGAVNAFNYGPVTVTASAGGKSATQRFFALPDSGLLVTTTGVTPGAVVELIADLSTSGAAEVRYAPGGNPSRYLIAPTPFAQQRIRAFDIVQTFTANGGGPFYTGVVRGVAAATAPIATTPGPPNTFAYLDLHPYTASVTVPDTVSPGQLVTVTWMFDQESSALLTIAPRTVSFGTLSVFNAPPAADLAGTSTTPTTITPDASGRWKFTSSFTAPSTPGKVYLQVSAAIPFPAYGYLVYPSVERGEQLIAITVR